MKKYLSFFKIVFKSELSKLVNNLGTIVSYCVHISVLCMLWEFVLGPKIMAGYTKEKLIWYVIIAETIIYSYHNYYRSVSRQVETGKIAYDMIKPYNYILRIIFEGLGLLPLTFTLLIFGSVIGFLVAGPINISLVQVLLSFIVIIISCILLLFIHIIIGLTSIWIGKDTSSVWLIIQKLMLIFAFTPIELMPKVVQKPLLLLPTTHVIYTPSKLIVDFSYGQLFKSLFVYDLGAILILTLVFVIIYKKGVKKLNVNGI